MKKNCYDCTMCAKDWPSWSHHCAYYSTPIYGNGSEAEICAQFDAES
ncbi:MAG: hypothetical protein MJZ30_11565 [Paludibacteraceae bacterium]|nr:hypothetical protein [Paludibacteraceae bacterium]